MKTKTFVVITELEYAWLSKYIRIGTIFLQNYLGGRRCIEVAPINLRCPVRLELSHQISFLGMFSLRNKVCQVREHTGGYY